MFIAQASLALMEAGSPLHAGAVSLIKDEGKVLAKDGGGKQTFQYISFISISIPARQPKCQETTAATTHTSLASVLWEIGGGQRGMQLLKKRWKMSPEIF